MSEKYGGAAPSKAQLKFLEELRRWSRVATPQELGPQIYQEENSARQTYKRHLGHPGLCRPGGE